MEFNRSNLLFRLLSLAALLAAAYHLAGVLGYLPDSRAPMWRHMLFVGIDIAASIYLNYRPLWALPLFVVLTVQQSWSHGYALYSHWQNMLNIDWLSLATLIGLYAGLALLMCDAKRRLSQLSV
jgi:membrane-anchored glycerophosphoryl diester phosphodiesterase (GDPDase)